MDMILDKCIFQNRFLCFQKDMLLVHIGIASYVHSIIAVLCP